MCSLCIFAQGFEFGPDPLCTWREASSNSVAPDQFFLSLLLTWSCCSPPAHRKKTFLQLSSFSTLAVRKDDLLRGFASYFASGLLCVIYRSWWPLLAQEHCFLMLTLGCLFTLYRAHHWTVIFLEMLWFVQRSLKHFCHLCCLVCVSQVEWRTKFCWKTRWVASITVFIILS